MKKAINLFIISVLLVLYFSCTKDYPINNSPKDQDVLSQYLNLPKVPFNYASQSLPDFFNDQFIQIQNNTPANNKVTDWGATLGRVLFYDTRLSANSTVACASCHNQKFGFTDTAQFSKGFKGGATKRHSMSLINAAFYSNGRFFWDERAASLEDQVLQPVQDAVEMGMQLDTLVNRLNATPFYPVLFKYAFPDAQINSVNISKALAQFVRSMISFDSKYDIGLIKTGNRLVDFPNFTVEENLGKTIFMTNNKVNCSGCHNTNAFIMDNPRNNGLKFTNEDSGIYVHSKNVVDIGKFKAPSLKNIAMRGRYMHDGSIVGLANVINHYNIGIIANPYLDNHLKDINGNPETMNLTPLEINALQAFLETLSDNRIITDEKFSSPFY